MNGVTKMNKYVNHSGGCPGADMTWETEGNRYGVKTISYSYKGHQQNGEFPYIMNSDELYEGWQHIQTASTTLKRPLGTIEYNPYIRNLLCRNWFQVKNADSIFAVGKFDGKLKKKVAGGTGWAVQMGIDSGKPVFFFDQPTGDWYMYVYNMKVFLKINVIPTLTHNFAGIGTRDMNTLGIKAIQLVYELNFNPIN